MRQHSATTFCMGGRAQARKGMPASCFEAFLFFMDTPRFHARCISKMPCVYPARRTSLPPPALLILFYLFLLEREGTCGLARFLGWDLSATASLG